jgi:N-sulfoglucosamine sulfohydrolase
MMQTKRNSRREFLKTTLAGTASIAGSAFILPDESALHAMSERTSDADRPNIVLIVSDDHGREALPCYGNTIVKTPGLDQLANDSIRFENAFCTTASCSPSRSVILTGMHNHATGQYGLQHDFHHFSAFDRIKSLSYFLSRAGYKTARAGKFHLAPGSVYPFDEVLYDGAANDMDSLARSPVELARRCTDFIKNTDIPFFLYFCPDDPHRGMPYDTWPEPNRFGNREAAYPGVTEIHYNPADVVVPPFLPDTAEARKELSEYYQAVSRLDQGVGKLLEILRQNGKYDKTVILYLSDNGVAFPGAKTTLYEPGMRLPCLIKLPQNAGHGTVSNAMISWCDITPTILDFAGAVPADQHFHGRSFRDVLESGRDNGWDEVYASHTFHGITQFYPMRVVRGRRYKLIRNLFPQLRFPLAADLVSAITWQGIVRRHVPVYGKRAIESFLQRPEYELYDLVNDPDEIVNLVDDPAHKKIAVELRSKLREFQKNTTDPWAEI